MKNTRSHTLRGFIFSLDAFVAFTLALIAIYSLIFFSSIPSGYYNTLLQAHYLSKDTLLALSQTKCSASFYPECGNDNSISVLEHIIFRTKDTEGSINFFIGTYIPNQFGYSFAVSDDADSWTELYNSKSTSDVSDLHNKKSNKLTVSSHIIVFQYSGQLEKPKNPYNYLSCEGDLVVCDVPTSTYEVPTVGMKIVRLTVFI